MLRKALLAAMLFCLTAAAAAGDKNPDPHLAAAATSSMVRKSAFIHGYLHGYEEGFHLGDIDLQVGRSSRDISKSKEGRNAEEYRSEFGDKHYFTQGYRQGVRVGYADAISGRSFRAVSELTAAIAPAPDPGPAKPDLVFDQGFSRGYASGQRRGLQDGRRDAAFTGSDAACPASGAKDSTQLDFCSAFASGYRVGYSDGFTNVVRSPVVQAEARGR